jgi:hypothetical protein
MSEDPAFDPAEPNAVLRGPLDGERLHLANRVPIRIEVGEDRCVCVPRDPLSRNRSGECLSARCGTESLLPR